MLPLSVAALMTNQVDLDEPRHRVAGLRPGPDRVWLLGNDPGLVCDRPRRLIAARADASRRSIVAGDITISSAASSSLMSSSANRRRVGTSSAITGASRSPVGAPRTAQHNRSAVSTSGP